MIVNQIEVLVGLHTAISRDFLRPCAHSAIRRNGHIARMNASAYNYVQNHSANNFSRTGPTVLYS